MHRFFLGLLAAVMLTSPPSAAVAEPQVTIGQPDLAAEYLANRAAPSDYPAVEQVCRVRALANDPVGLTCLGFMYAHGNGVPLDEAQAIVWWRKAAAKGDIRAEDALGAMYQFGHSVPVNCPEAARWFSLTADQGSPWGMYNLSAMAVQKCLPLSDAQTLAWLDISIQKMPSTASREIAGATALRAQVASHMSSDQLAQAAILVQNFRPSTHYPAAALTVLERLPSANPPETCSQVRGPLETFYPDLAQRRNVGGRVLTACKISSSGTPTTCTWTEENPGGYGFGEAAAKLACSFKFDRPDIVTAPEWVAAATIRFAPPNP
jgi:hypothetical protein